MMNNKHPARGILTVVCGLLLGLAFLLLPVVITSTAMQSGELNSEACIRCHAGVFDAGLRQTFVHPPFFERQCTACHQESGGERLATTEAETTAVTGSTVSQADLWRKPLIYRGDSRTFDQLFSLNDLRFDVAYRLRIVVGEEPDIALAASRWLGLDLSEMATADPAVIYFADDPGSTLRDYVDALQISTLASGTTILAWRTTEPLYGWVELQELEGLDIADLAPGQESDLEPAAESGQHPALKTPEDLAITACYQCHPESSLGTSHPVRLYTGRDVRIPAELPTVEGMLTCVTCHDPHGAEGKMLVRETIKTKLCVACHFKFKNSSPSTMFN